MPWGLVIPGVGGVIAIASVAFWLGRRSKNQLLPSSAGLSHLPEDSANGAANRDFTVFSDQIVSVDKSPVQTNNHHVTSQEKDVSRHK
jgi:hypothetical protein